MTAKHILAITGGVGGAKLALGLSKLLGPEDLSFVVNTGDDFTHLGFPISPDIDTLVYTLSGTCNTETGWGRSEEGWQFMQALKEMGGETWFALGDKDLAMHVERRRLLDSGATLTETTTALAQSFGIAHRIYPMSDERVSTTVLTRQGKMDFQHYFVREKCEPSVTGFEFEGAAQANVNPVISELLDSPGLKGVILCPSNPYVSIDPILSIPGFRKHLKVCRAPVIAVSPVIGGAAVKGPTVKMMRELNIPNTADNVASHYADFLDGFVVDSKDSDLTESIDNMSINSVITNTLMKTHEDKINLGRTCLEFIDQLGACRT
jgi:LPPG:FO 2-phospho-L-lactate transferase